MERGTSRRFVWLRSELGIQGILPVGGMSFLLQARFFGKLTIFAGYGIMGQEFFMGEVVMMTKKHVIIPLVGTDSIKIGMPREELRREYSDLYERTIKRGEEFDYYTWFSAIVENDVICAVEFFEPEVYFDGVQLIGLDFEACKRLFLRYDEDLRFEKHVTVAGFCSTKLKIGIYAPYGVVESVLVGKSGYYH